MEGHVPPGSPCPRPGAAPHTELVDLPLVVLCPVELVGGPKRTLRPSGPAQRGGGACRRVFELGLQEKMGKAWGV